MRKHAFRRRRLKVAGGAAAALGLAATMALTLPSAAGAQTLGHQGRGHHWNVSVVASHLNNPRGLSPAPGGGLYLAEAGAGGSVCVPGGEQGQTCLGLTGSFDLVTRHGVKRLVSGLISGSGPGGVGAEGPVSVSSDGFGQFYGLFGLSSHEVPPPGAIPGNLRSAALDQLGHLVKVRGWGPMKDVSDVGDQDYAWTTTRINLAPKDFPDANPNNVLASWGHRYVVDAGSNLLVDVKRDGTARVRAFIGVPKGSVSDSVPTCVARGPDGALYVGELLGGQYAPGHASIIRVVPGHAPRVWATGLTTVQGCGFGRDGAFYATEFQTSGLNESPTGNPAGDVVRIDRWGHRTHLGVGQLFYPSGFAAGRDGSIYVSNCSIAPGTGMGPNLCPSGGQVVRIG
ncbi:MAG TPA: ScyD/ScyE family protein [Streptosporangiaceae bacterium]|nr:ScyD/ScyE family protein [Streptosporangiaceae bacterium]